MGDRQAFLQRYLEWCLGQVREELESGTPNLAWVGHPIFGFLVGYLGQKPLAQAVELFSAMQYRKLCHKGLEWQGEKKARHEVMLQNFMYASKKHRRAKGPYETLRRASFEVARSTLIKRLVWNKLKELGWKKLPWNPGIVKCSKEVDRVTVNTFLSAETKEFCYWQQVIDGSGEILIETSFAEWFGLGYYTIFMHNERGSEERISRFVVEKSQLFIEDSGPIPEPPAG